MSDWLGLTLTRVEKQGNRKVSIPTTNEWAVAYTAKKFGVPEAEIELERDNTMIRVRVKGDMDELSFNQWLYEIYGFPTKEDEFYSKFAKFGYGVWLINKHPDIFSPPGKTVEEIYNEERVDYYWYLILNSLPDTIENKFGELDETALGAVLSGNRVYSTSSEKSLVLPLFIPCDSLGIYVRPAGTRLLLVFLTDEDELIPWAVRPDEVEEVGEFDGFE